MDGGHERGIGRIGPLLIVGVMALLIAGCGGSSSSHTTSRPTTADIAGGSGHAQVAERVPEVRVPKLVGERFEAAVREVARVGLEQHAPAFTGTDGNPHYNGNCMRILTQSPPAGARLPKGATVSIVYGVCPKAIAKAHRKPRG